MCESNACVCDKPWGGRSCGALQYAVTPAVAKSVYPETAADKRNTWNGPIVGPDVNGTYHIFLPIYPVQPGGNLAHASKMLHGIASKIEGPWTWGARPDIPIAAINPAYLAFPNADNGNQTKHSLWVGSRVWVADTLDGPYDEVKGSGFPSNNAAPIYHDGAFFLTTQTTRTILTTKKLGSPWTTYATIDAGPNEHRLATIEDPYLWVDKRGNWHVINHAYNTSEFYHCGSSRVSAHLFSGDDGHTWHMAGGADASAPPPEPYHHTVRYDDGTAHTYCTLERPNLHFDAATGTLTHINLAADMVTGDAGCAARTEHCPARDPMCACTNCKYLDHAGTIVVALEV